MSNVSILKGVKDRLWIDTEAKVRQDNGNSITIPFKLQCKKPSTTRVKELQVQMRDEDVYDEDLAHEFIVDWKLPGADGTDLEFTEEHLDIVLDEPDYLKAIGQAMLELIYGPEVLKVKNSNSSGGPGRKRR